MSEEKLNNERKDMIGNKFWLLRTRHGPKLLMESPEKLEKACLEYFDSVADNPLYEDKVGWYEGKSTHEPVAKMRVMSLGGLCLYLRIDRSTWGEWRKTREDLSPVIRWVDETIRTQQLTGATAGLLNANIIARLLGLADKQEVDHKSSDGSMSLSSCPSFQRAMDEIEAEEK